MNRYRTHAVAVLIALTLGAGAAAFQPPTPPLAPTHVAPTEHGDLSVNIAQMETPVKGQPFRFSLCSGASLAATTASGPCHAAEAAKTVGGAAQNSLIVFRLQNGSFLPPGLHLNGDGVITGTTTADVSQLSVKICAIQVGGSGTCQPQTVGFNGGKAAIMRPPPAPAAAVAPAAAGGGGMGVGTAVGLGLAGAGATIAAVKVLPGLTGPDCSSQQSALDNSANSLVAASNSLSSCGSNVTCINSRLGTVNSGINSIINAAGNLCTCMGSTELNASDKALVVDLLAQVRALGTSTGSLPSCFR